MWPKRRILFILANHNKRKVNHQSVQISNTEATLNIFYLLQTMWRDFPI